ncbi:GPI biosynthesis protein Pig-F, partial [Lasiosphaeris hirsuta]
ATAQAQAQVQLPSKGKEASWTLPPIQINQTPAAQAARHGLPALLAALFVFRFDALVADPVSTMATAIPVVAALQLGYALVCLPVVGSQAARPGQKPRPGEKTLKKVVNSDGTSPNAPVATLLSLLLTLFSTPLLHAVMVLFGAPALSHTAHTLLCAAHLAVLALFPLFYAHGVDGPAWAALASFRAPLDEPFGGLAGALVGAWLGAVPIPLDWDREWQRWPVTILCGVYGGYLLGRVLGGRVGFGRRL